MLDPLRDDATRESLNKLRSMDDTVKFIYLFLNQNNENLDIRKTRQFTIKRIASRQLDIRAVEEWKVSFVFLYFLLKIIFIFSPRILVLEQDYHCAECGIKIEKAMWKRMRFSTYFIYIYAWFSNFQTLRVLRQNVLSDLSSGLEIDYSFENSASVEFQVRIFLIRKIYHFSASTQFRIELSDFWQKRKISPSFISAPLHRSW